MSLSSEYEFQFEFETKRSSRNGVFCTNLKEYEGRLKGINNSWRILDVGLSVTPATTLFINAQ